MRQTTNTTQKSALYLPRLREANAAVDVQRIVHEEFVRWFGADLVGPLTDYAEVAEKIWGTWLDCGQYA